MSNSNSKFYKKGSAVLIVIFLLPFILNEYKKMFHTTNIKETVIEEISINELTRNPLELNVYLQKTTIKDNSEFMKAYYTAQADILNKWLSLTAIFLTGLGLIGLLGYWRFVDEAKNKIKDLDDDATKKIKEIKDKSKSIIKEFTRTTADSENDIKTEIINFKKEFKSLYKIVDGHDQYIKDKKNGIISDNFSENENITKKSNISVDANPNNWEKARTLFLEGFNLSKLNKPEEAIEKYTKSINLHPNASSYNNRGVEHNKLKQFQKAFEDYEKAISMNQNNSGYAYNLGNSYANKRDYSNSKVYLEKAYNLDTEKSNSDFKFLNSLANTYMHLGELNKALKMIDKALSLENTIKEESEKQILHITRAEILLLDSKLKKSLNLYKSNKERFKNLKTDKVTFNKTISFLDNFRNPTDDEKKIIKELKDIIFNMEVI